MIPMPARNTLRVTAITIAIGAAGALVAQALGLPAAVLMGPALLVSVAGLAGLRTLIPDPLRDLCFVVLGSGIGAGFDPDAGAAILTWPLAFVVLGLSLAVMMLLSTLLLIRAFGFEPRAAVLSSAPGHLSFTMGLATEVGTDVGRVALVQSIRLLSITITVPFAALALGVPEISMAGLGGKPASFPELAALLLIGLGTGMTFRRLGVPAPVLVGAMVSSGLAHVTGAIQGGVPTALMLPAFALLGSLIGTRFSGMSVAAFLGSLAAGLAVTLLSALIGVLASVPIAYWLGFPLAHVFAGFAPGGVETMIALGAVLGASPGFVAACHVMRLMFLTLLIPMALRQVRISPTKQG